MDGVNLSAIIYFNFFHVKSNLKFDDFTTIHEQLLPCKKFLDTTANFIVYLVLPIALICTSLVNKKSKS